MVSARIWAEADSLGTAMARAEHKWSAAVTKQSDALDLKPDIFSSRDPKALARSLKHSADVSKRRKADPYRSAMSMLTFYINRAGKNLPAAQERRLEAAKDELRLLFNRPPSRKSAAGHQRHKSSS
jgi:hypothetical protein